MKLQTSSVRFALVAFICGFALSNCFHGFLYNPSNYQNYPNDACNQKFEGEMINDTDNNNNHENTSIQSSIIHGDEYKNEKKRKFDVIDDIKTIAIDDIKTRFSSKGMSKSDTSSFYANVINADDDFCAVLATNTTGTSSIPSTISIWSQHINSIFNSSRHIRDPEYIYHDFTAQLLRYMTPQKLQSSVKKLPNQHWDTVGRVVDLAFERWKYLNSKKIKDNTHDETYASYKPRKVNILVMGGSVTMGVLCASTPVADTIKGPGKTFARRDCAWPARFNYLIHSILGFEPHDIFQVDVLTLGGTNSETATTIWDLSLMPKNTPYPGIVIHGYATNDMHVLSELEAKKKNKTLEEMILQVNQVFIRKVLSPKLSGDGTCRRPLPLLVYYDDYLGNEQRKILETNAFAKATEILSSYYGFNLISYADAVRELVYSNTNEYWFSPSEWPERQVHPGMGMHIASSWLIAFNFLHLATTFCSMNISSNNHGDDVFSEIRKSNTVNTNYQATNGYPELRKTGIKYSGEPVQVLNSLPPELNDALTLDNISEIWKQEGEIGNSVTGKLECAKDAYEMMPRSCVYSWVGNLERKFDKASHLDRRLKLVLTSNDGWESMDDNSKLGFCATKKNAKFEMIVKNVDLPVRALNFMVMKSYGHKWQDSEIVIDAFVLKKSDDAYDNKRPNNMRTMSMNIPGYHDKNTSESYTYRMDLGIDGKDVALHEDLMVQIELIGGSTFKILGMAFCDH